MWQIKLAALIAAEVLAVALTIKPSKKWAVMMQDTYVRASTEYSWVDARQWKSKFMWWIFRFMFIFFAVVLTGMAFSILLGPVITPPLW